MIHSTLSSGARPYAVLALAGIASAGCMVVGGERAAASSEPPRFTIESAVDCSGPTITFFYDDHVDGHVPVTVHEEFDERGNILWSADEVHQVNGDYFNERTFPMAGQALTDLLYGYMVSITYDDGVQQSDGVLVDLAEMCGSGTPPTTAPPQAPEPDRFALFASGFWCGGEGSDAYVEWNYADYADGHTPARYDIDVLKNGTSIERLSVERPYPTFSEDLGNFHYPDVDGDATYFVLPSEVLGGQVLEVASYSLSVTVTYEDGVTDKHIETFDLAQICTGRVNAHPATPATNTTTPTAIGTLPETGSSDITWLIGAVGGVLLTVGAALLAGARTSRSN